MDLELLISPSGLGKTEHIINEIAKEKDNSKIIVLTPEQNGYNFERILCDRFNGTFNIDVANFNSLSRKLVKEIDNNKLISDEINLFYYLQIAEDLKESNNFLVNRMINDVNFIEIVDNIIKELKEYNIDLDQLDDYINNLDNDSHKEKVKAIREIYFNYNLKLQNNKKLDKTDYIDNILLCLDYIDLSNYIFYIDGYYNFTLKEYLYIEKLVTNSKKVVISIISDISRYVNCNLEQLIKGYDILNLKYYNLSLNDVYKNVSYSLDIYRKSHEIIAHINNIIKKLKITRYNILTIVQDNNKANKILLELENNKILACKNLENYDNRYKDNFSLAYLVNQYPKILKSQTNIFDDSVQVFEADDMELEIKQVARNIIKIKKEYEDKELKLKNEDIAILYRNSDYEKYKYIFKNYNLNVHIDKDLSIENHRLIKLLENILKFDDNNLAVEIMNILKTKLTNFDNIYKQHVLNYICYDTFKVTKTLEKKSLSTTIGDINLTDEKKSLLNQTKTNDEKIVNSIKVLKEEDIERILRSKLIKNINDFENELFIKEDKKYSQIQLEIVRYILKEIYSKILKIKKSKKVDNYIKNITKILDYFDIKMLLEKEKSSYENIDELEIESIDRQVYKKFLVILDNLQKNLGSYNVKFTYFRDLFLLAIKKINYRSIPVVNDLIIMSVMDLAKVENKKVVFVVGFNKNTLPRKISNNSILDDIDKEKFIDKNIFLSPTSKNLLIDEEFVSYIALSRSSEKVIISYSKLDINYKHQDSSIYLNNFKIIFNNFTIRSTDKILKFDVTNLDYYSNNVVEFYNVSEFNYIYSKLINSYFSMLKNKVNTAENFLYSKLKEVLIKYNRYNIYKKYDINIKNYNVDRVLVDEIYDDNIVYHNSYMEYLKEVYEFFLSTENKQKYLEYNKSFSNFSSSKVKDYVKSPYIFFVKRVLGIFQEENYEITPFNKGNFYHAVMEDSRILEYVAKQGELLANLDEIDQFDENKYLIPVRSLLLEVINNTINDNIVDFMTIINSKKMNYYEFNTIINRLTKLIIYEIYYTAISGYKATEVEKNFEFTITGDKIIYKDDDKEKFINLPRVYNIPTISFRGKIDRIDQKDNKYLLIDYKSSKSDFEYSKFYNGEDSQLLTYLIATILLKDIKIEQVLGIFYRQITEDKSNVRLKGLVNQDVLLGEDFARSASKIMFAGITKENKVNGHYKNRTLTSSEFEKFVKINIDNILTTIEKIYSFDYSALNKETELQELYDYSKNKLNSDDNNKSVGNTAQVKKLLLEKDL